MNQRAVDAPAGAHLRPPPGRRVSLSALWHDTGVRSWLYQALIVVGVLVLGSFLIGNAQDALHRQGITTGFSFLQNAAGFEIGERLIDFESSDSIVRAYQVAVLNTLKVSFVSIAFATVIGLVIGLGRLSSNGLARGLSSLYVEVFRNTPQLVLLIFCYTLLTKLPAVRDAVSFRDVAFLSNRGLSIPWLASDGAFSLLLIAVAASLLLLWPITRWIDRRRFATGRRQLGPTIGGFLLAGTPLALLALLGPPLDIAVPELRGLNFAGGTTLSPEFLALTLGMSLYIGAFIAEIVRAGIQSVSRGQVEAAQSVGLSRFDIYRRVVFPQAMRVMVPPAAIQYVSILKNSSLGVAIGYPELFNVNNTIVTLSGQAVEGIAIMMTIYLAISFTIAASMNLYNRMVQIKER
jgi:general L-amino acid transport system permease protein